MGAKMIETLALWFVCAKPTRRP